MKLHPCLIAAAELLALPAWALATAPIFDLPDCPTLAAQIAKADDARRKAADEADNAWKAVVPFVVLARKASAKSALDEAGKRLADLKAQQQSARCTVPQGAHDAQ
jgi:hypothetical protein